MLLSGAPGVHKSRLLRAFQYTLDETGRTRVQWHCLPYYQTSANYPAIEQLRRNVGIDGQGGEQCLDMLEAMVEGLRLDRAKAPESLQYCTTDGQEEAREEEREAAGEAW